MKKSQLFEDYNDLVEKGDKIDEVVLYIHMPGGETETICNPAVEAKMKYIDDTYDDDLVHANCKQIYITNYEFITCTDENFEYSFQAALSHLELGDKVARKNWNGKDQYVYMVPAAAYAPCTKAGREIVNDEGKVEYNAYFALKTVQGKVSTWVPSVTDLLAKDWYTVE